MLSQWYVRFYTVNARRVLVFTIASLTVLTAFVYVRVDHGVTELKLGPYNRISCDLSGDGPVFRALLLRPLAAHKLLEDICAIESISDRFAGVEVVWLPRSHWTEADNLQSHLHLVAGARDLQIDRLTTGLETSYKKLGFFSGIASQVSWVSGYDLMKDGEIYLEGKRIGLINDQNSISRYNLPMAYLRQHNWLPDKVSLAFYDSSTAMIQALGQGEVDVISLPDMMGREIDAFRFHYGETDLGYIYLDEDSPPDLDCALLQIFDTRLEEFDLAEFVRIQRTACLK